MLCLYSEVGDCLSRHGEQLMSRAVEPQTINETSGKWEELEIWAVYAFRGVQT